MIKISKLFKEEKGESFVIVIFVLFVLMVVGGLVVDLGIVYNHKIEMRKAANAAALSGIQKVFASDSDVTRVVDDILKAHNEKDNLQSLQIKPKGENKVTVTLKKETPLFFIRIFGKNSAELEVSSSAIAGPLGAITGAVPLGVPKDVIKNLGTGYEYDLKVAPGESEYGNFGIIGLSSSWNVGKDYEHDLTYGYAGEIKIGQILDTETGNVKGKTSNGIAYRFSHSPNSQIGPPEEGIDIKNDTRLLKVIVYEEMPHNGNQLKEVKVVGFAYFYLKGPYDDKSSSIKGYFIEGIESGSVDDSAVEKGVYGIRLVE